MLRAQPHARRRAPQRPPAPPLGGAQPSPSAPAPGPAPNPYDTTPDATLQAMLAALGERRGAANADALRLRKQYAIDYGDSDLARALGLDESTISAAGQNPFSTVAKEHLNEQNQPRELTQNLNRQNLFYSSTFGQQQSDLARSLLEQRSNDQHGVRDRLSGVESGLAGAMRQAQEDEIQARQDAADRARQRLGDNPVGTPTPGHGSPLLRAMPTAPRRQQPRITAAPRHRP